MAQETRTAETPMIESLLSAFQRGAVSRREFLRRAGLLGLSAAGAGVLADAAAPARVLAQTTQKREVVVAQGGDVSKFDPHFSTSSNDIRVSFNVFDNLTSRHPDQKLHPSLATEWKATDATTWTFKLRPGVKWHNGDPFTAADAKFSIERTFDPAAKTMVATVFTTIDRIETPDPLTLVVHTKKSDPLLPDRLAFYGGQIVPKKYLEDVGPDTFNAKPVGTGPLKLSSWTKDDKAVFEGFADYWGGKIDVDRVVFRPIPETAPRVAALLKGEVDAMTQLPSDHWDRVNQNATTRGVGRPVRGPVRPRHQRQEPAAQQRARAPGHVAGRGPRVHREGDVPGPRDRPQRADRPGRPVLRLVAAAAPLRPEGSAGAREEVRVQERADRHRDDDRVRRPGQGHVRGDRRRCGRTWA